MTARLRIDRGLAGRIRGSIARYEFERAIVLSVEMGPFHADPVVWDAYCYIHNGHATPLEKLSAAIDRLSKFVGKVGA